MTTEYTRNKSPRLPDNYAAHVDRLLPDRNRFGLKILAFSLGFLATAAIAFAAYVLLSS